jgi:hypothetical protein
MFTCGDLPTSEVVMHEAGCEQARESAAEFALGILPEPEKGQLAEHFLRCHDCRSEADSFTEIAILLWGVVAMISEPA